MLVIGKFEQNQNLIAINKRQKNNSLSRKPNKELNFYELLSSVV
jgi:hypothetical protein